MKLLELTTPSLDNPALINVDSEKGMTYYSPKLWRYIRFRTRNDALRGLDKRLLYLIRNYYGEWTVELILAMQMHGRKVSVEKAVK